MARHPDTARPKGSTPNLQVRIDDGFAPISAAEWIPLSKPAYAVPAPPRGEWTVQNSWLALRWALRIARSVGFEPRAQTYVVFADSAEEWWAVPYDEADTLPYLEGSSPSRWAHSVDVKAWGLTFGLTVAEELPQSLFDKVGGADGALAWALMVFEYRERAQSGAESHIQLAFEAGQRFGSFEERRRRRPGPRASTITRKERLKSLLGEHPEWRAMSALGLARELRTVHVGPECELKQRLMGMTLPDADQLARELSAIWLLIS